MDELMECIKRFDRQGILRIINRDYILNQKVKEVIDRLYKEQSTKVRYTFIFLLKEKLGLE